MVSVCSTSLFRTTWSCRCRRCRRCPAHQRAHPERFEQRRLGAQLGSQGTQRAHGNPKGFSPFLDAIGFQHFFLKHVLYIIIHYYTTYIQHIYLYKMCTTCINMYCMHLHAMYLFLCVSVSDLGAPRALAFRCLGRCRARAPPLSLVPARAQPRPWPRPWPRGPSRRRGGSSGGGGTGESRESRECRLGCAHVIHMLSCD